MMRARKARGEGEEAREIHSSVVILHFHCSAKKRLYKDKGRKKCPHGGGERGLRIHVRVSAGRAAAVSASASAAAHRRTELLCQPAHPEEAQRISSAARSMRETRTQRGTHSGSAMRAAMSGMPPPAPPAPPAPPPSPPIICWIIGFCIMRSSPPFCIICWALLATREKSGIAGFARVSRLSPPGKLGSKNIHVHDGGVVHHAGQVGHAASHSGETRDPPSSRATGASACTRARGDRCRVISRRGRGARSARACSCERGLHGGVL